MQSQLNDSAGQKQKLILESEGAREAAKNEGEAIAQQGEILARSLAVPSSEPTDADRRKALDALLEYKRLEQLRAIANGHGNSTYFFGDAKGTNIGRDAYEIDNNEKWKRSLDARNPIRYESLVNSKA